MPESTSGLSEQEAAKLLAQYGPNLIAEKKRSLLRRLAGWVATPMSLMFALAAALSLWSGDRADASIIGILFITNIGVGAWHEAKADTAIAKLKEKLSVTVKVNRGGSWIRLSSSELVPGDIIEMFSGDLIPADVEFVTSKNVSVNEGVVTGESLPKQKAPGDTGYSGSFLSTGLAVARVTATGARTYFGKTLALVEGGRKPSQLERDILSISRFLSVVSVVIMAALTAILALAHLPLVDIATLDVSMLIAGIPVALPTVMTLIISVGVVGLARKSVIVRRLSSLEDLADVDLLLSDKTGTLTENRIEVVRMVPLASGMADGDIWGRALAGAPFPDSNPLDSAIQAKAKELGMAAVRSDDFIPGDSERKHATAFISEGGKRAAVALGAPQTIEDLCDFGAGARARYDELVAEAAKEGYRVLVLAESADEKERALRPLAIFFLADAVRADAKKTIDFLHEYGIAVKMVTGDGYDVAAHVAAQLGLEGRIVRRSELEKDPAAIREGFSSLGGFSEVMPKDKYGIVTMAQHAQRPYVVAVTGDGVNDVPPVRSANVGIAVSNAVDALKGTADIVLTRAGISVIKDAIIEARKIFARLYNYSVYRISESFRLIVTIAVIGGIFHAFPLTPVQIILIALLNDVPIISLAYDRVGVSKSPSAINVRRRLGLSLIFGTVGIANSMFLLWILVSVIHAPWLVIQTVFFLKLTVSGHMLVYIAHTEKPWYSFLPSKQVIWATSITQAVATTLALAGIFVAPITLPYAVLVWVWSFVWMQIGEGAKRAFFRMPKRVAGAGIEPAVSRL